MNKEPNRENFWSFGHLNRSTHILQLLDCVNATKWRQNNHNRQSYYKETMRRLCTLYNVLYRWFIQNSEYHELEIHYRHASVSITVHIRVLNGHTHAHNTNKLQALTTSAQQQHHNQLQRRSDTRQESHHLTVIAYMLFSHACQTGLQMFG